METSLEISSIETSCIYENRPYPDGSRIQGYLAVLVCRDREWHDMDEGADDSKPSLAYIYH